jgi:hypothetical protein
MTGYILYIEERRSGGEKRQRQSERAIEEREGGREGM